VYLREDQILPRLDHWLAQVFSPEALADTLRQLEQAQDDGRADATAEQLRHTITDCDAKLRQHRAVLEARADPVLVTSWITETQARRAAAVAAQKNAPRGNGSPRTRSPTSSPRPPASPARSQRLHQQTRKRLTGSWA
jgi:site-specific DNA recombinase